MLFLRLYNYFLYFLPCFLPFYRVQVPNLLSCNNFTGMMGFKLRQGQFYIFKQKNNNIKFLKSFYKNFIVVLPSYPLRTEREENTYMIHLSINIQLREILFRVLINYLGIFDPLTILQTQFFPSFSTLCVYGV